MKHSTLKHIIKNIFKFNIRQKLILTYIFIVAVPLSILQVNAFYRVRIMTEKEYINNVNFEVSKLKNDIMKNIEQFIKATQFILNNQEFIEFASTYQERNVEDIYSFKVNVLDKIEYLQYVNFNINRIRFFTNNHFIPEMWPTLYHIERLKNFKFIDKFLSDKKQTSLWKLNNTDILGPPLNSDEKVVSLYTKVTDLVGNLIGIIEVNMKIDEFFASELSRESDNSVTIAISQNGDAIFSKQTPPFLKRLNLSSKKLVELLEDKVKTIESEGIVHFKINKNSAAFIYTYIPVLGVKLYKIILFDELTKKINEITLQMLGQALVLIIISSILIFILITLILKKLRQVILSMRAVENGNFDISIDIKGDDEIDELAQHFLNMVEKLKILIGEMVRREVAQKDAQIKALQSQINAHFIYNVLENIKMMAEYSENYDVSDAITKLGKMMRYNMSWKRKFVTLKEEIENIQNYISLMNIRYDNEIKLLVNVDNEILNIEVPKLILQPIVENAINYGIEPKGEGGSIFIDGSIIGNYIVISIIDDGLGIEEEKLVAIQTALENDTETECYHGQGIALKNVNERIKLAYGKEFGIKIDSKFGEFTKVTITLPYNRF
ncbi:integral membrane sensor signal transduction histidine kinase [Caldicellulosiruptor kronotskyensis 2002]|uniref:histidine kinase n=1 Tax=Caldicellulosiruptor kronotskyensis (strain DSM 18902 / VKM B-2412 / 2002) TaxID=632348 RepID=E4SCD1_CALK2|nr:histidine kinase [Caldicellulosiruptor kronotskyensis]ADQ44986.1 integral membrane sensor signal transduction histidine kinase [Caldicellulosiruptor kronotskyensis 2002]